jgi:uncharacterized protein YndB with AHSA1/START domain
MKQTIFNPDTSNHKMLVEREFDADLPIVWQAWTDEKMLDEWWAPLPWKAVTKSMDFREGGTWMYYMQGPAGERHDCRADYIKIAPLKKFEGKDSFTDEEGNITNTAPSMHWDVSFTETGKATKVNVIITFANNEDMETIIKMGFKEGFSMAHGNLDELLKKLVAVQS